MCGLWTAGALARPLRALARMSQIKNRLSARDVANATRPGMHGDGGGLYLRVQKAGSKQWVYVYHLDGKRREAGLGGYPTVGLTEARAKRDAGRAKVLAGDSPNARRRRDRRLGSGATFGEVALGLLADIEVGFRNAKHRTQWRTSLQTHAAVIWNMRVTDVETEDVLDVLRPIWMKIPETAERVRGRMERVLDAARVRGLRPPGENPARWRGHLALIMPDRKNLVRRHHAAMPYPQVPAFLAMLRQREGISPTMLELTVLLATRSGETLGARRSEVDLEAELWTIPGDRMKMGIDHRIPLVGRALEIMRQVCDGRAAGDYLFPSWKPGRSASNMAMAMLMRRMNIDFTVHGFRSAFRDWAGDCTDFAEEIVEQSLAHSVGSQVRRAYRRGDALEKRRDLMKAWDSFCGSTVEGKGPGGLDLSPEVVDPGAD